jgi:hypothetical protein
MSALDDIEPVRYEWSDDGNSIGIIAQEVSSCPGVGAVPPQSTTINISNNAIAGGAIGASNIFSVNNSGSVMGTMRPSSLSITSDPPILSTNKHNINIDEFYEDLIAIKQIMIEMAKDEDLMERNGIIRDILSTWLIKGLSK